MLLVSCLPLRHSTGGRRRGAGQGPSGQRPFFLSMCGVLRDDVARVAGAFGRYGPKWKPRLEAALACAEQRRCHGLETGEAFPDFFVIFVYCLVGLPGWEVLCGGVGGHDAPVLALSGVSEW